MNTLKSECSLINIENSFIKEEEHCHGVQNESVSQKTALSIWNEEPHLQENTMGDEVS